LHDPTRHGSGIQLAAEDCGEFIGKCLIAAQNRIAVRIKLVIEDNGRDRSQ